MSIADILNIHPLLSDRTRLAIMVTLAGRKDDVDFVSLRDELDLTQGNLSSHMRKLEEADLVVMSKVFEGRKPKTTFSCTKQGRKALEQYLAQVEKTLRATLGEEKK